MKNINIPIREPFRKNPNQRSSSWKFLHSIMYIYNRHVSIIAKYIVYRFLHANNARGVQVSLSGESDISLIGIGHECIGVVDLIPTCLWLILTKWRDLWSCLWVINWFFWFSDGFIGGEGVTIMFAHLQLDSISKRWSLKVGGRYFFLNSSLILINCFTDSYRSL